MKRLESSIQRAVVNYAKVYWGVLATKLGGMVGIDDYIFWVPGGKPLLIEFKREGEHLAPIQEYWANRFRKLGYDVRKCDSVEGGKAIISDTMEALGIPKEGP